MATNRSSKVEAFLNDIVAVYRKHGLSLSHEDNHGGFIVEELKEGNVKWLHDASEDVVEGAPDETARPLQERINEALDTAVWENGYHELMARPPQVVTIDLLDNDWELEDLARSENYAVIGTAVKDYQTWYHAEPRTGPRRPA